MPTVPRPLIDAFADLDVLVVGDALLDRWLHGSSTRLCREAPVPVVDLGEQLDVPGGAANAAVNLAALGARVTLLAVVGDDPEGRALCAAASAAGVETGDVVVDPDRRTAVKHRLTADGQLLLRFDQGSVGPLAHDAERAVLERLAGLLPRVDAVLVSDYDSGIRTDGVRRLLAGWRVSTSDRPRVCTVDARDPETWREVRPTAVTPNHEEAARVLALPTAPRATNRAEAVTVHGARLLERLGADIVAVTLDRDGAVVLERGQPTYRTYATPVDTARATGCGDTYMAALTLALAAGGGTVAAAELASTAAAVVVRKPGTAVCTAAELRADDPAGVKRLGGPEALAAAVGAHRLEGRRIVFTNGCFDLLHRGHVTYLSRSKALGDVLVVAVNDDESVARLKGPSRPINPVADRLEVLAALSCVDHVVAFGEDSPTALLRAACPDVYAKGGDYTRATLPEAPLVEELGGTVAFLDYLDDRSTTGMIERISRDPAGSTS